MDRNRRRVPLDGLGAMRSRIIRAALRKSLHTVNPEVYPSMGHDKRMR
jgi:hypothetical protein